MRTEEPSFNLYHSPYIALVNRGGIEVPADDPVQAAIYAPSTVCAYHADHQKTAAGTSHAFLVELPAHPQRQWGLVGPTCLASRAAYAGAKVGAWRRALDRRQALAGTGLDTDWRRTTLKRYWARVTVIALMMQVEPHHKLMRDLIDQVTTDKRELTAAQMEVLRLVLRERGGEAQGEEPELKAQLRVARQRRDLIFRLSRLATLDLEERDQSTVRSLILAATKWRPGTMATLTPSQEHLVGRLEARYLDQRRLAAERLADELASPGRTGS